MARKKKEAAPSVTAPTGTCPYCGSTSFVEASETTKGTRQRCECGKWSLNEG